MTVLTTAPQHVHLMTFTPTDSPIELFMLPTNHGMQGIGLLPTRMVPFGHVGYMYLGFTREQGEQPARAHVDSLIPHDELYGPAIAAWYASFQQPDFPLITSHDISWATYDLRDASSVKITLRKRDGDTTYQFDLHSERPLHPRLTVIHDGWKLEQHWNGEQTIQSADSQRRPLPASYHQIGRKLTQAALGGGDEFMREYIKQAKEMMQRAHAHTHAVQRRQLGQANEKLNAHLKKWLTGDDE